MNKKEVNFEESMQELEKVVQQLENDSLNLDDSIKLFEKGMKLSRDCNEYLAEAEKKITILINGENGKVEEKDFE